MKRYKRKKRDVTAYYEKQQPCWTCKNACGGCSWSREFKPVEGWEAVPRSIKSNGIHAETYKIINCPEYVKE